ncbi:MAG: hypothetical protein ACYC1K_03265 [Minisyncoccota bacterium]
MPKFKVPKHKDKKMGSIDPMPFMAHTYLPANTSMLKQLNVGDEIKVELTGKVTRLSMNEKDVGEFSLEIDTVEAYPKNEYEELSKDEGDTE